jgi:hypothetical protein
MSLQLAAQHMASKGRGPDTTLVHMAPQEVAGLQALAKAHGGSLTTNPDTGLPEAGFLSSILPMVAGAALAATGVGAPMAAMMVGGGMTVATGSLQKGLMAGLGAYGGAGLAGGLMGAGAAGAGAASTGLSALDAGMGVMPVGNIGAEALASSALDAGMGAMPTGSIGASALDAGMGAYPNASLTASPVAAPIQADLAVKNAVPTVTKAPTFMENVSQMGRGVQNLGTEAGRTAFMSKEGVGGGMGLMKYGLAGLAPMMFQEPERQPEKEKLQPYEYQFSLNPTGAASGYRPIGSPSGYDSSEMQHFDPRFVRKAAGGGIMDIGPVEAMSDRNQAQTLMANQGQMFAEGGETKAVKPVEQDPYYTMSGQSGDVFKYLMGQGSAPAAPARAVPVAVPAAPEQPTVAAAPAPAKTGLSGLSGLSGRLFAGLGQTPSSEDQGAGGYYEDDTSGRRDYTFDPNLGGFRAVAAPKVFRPYTPAPAVTNSQDVFYGAANGGLMSLAQGGQSHLGDYSDGGRLLRGPGDGVSDDIPASIGDKRPARLADGEFVVPARIVSELGNGSTEAGARKLYAMMDRVQKARKKSIGKDRVAVNSRAEKLLPV